MKTYCLVQWNTGLQTTSIRHKRKSCLLAPKKLWQPRSHVNPCQAQAADPQTLRQTGSRRRKTAADQQAADQQPTDQQAADQRAVDQQATCHRCGGKARWHKQTYLLNIHGTGFMLQMVDASLGMRLWGWWIINCAYLSFGNWGLSKRCAIGHRSTQRHQPLPGVICF